MQAKRQYFMGCKLKVTIKSAKKFYNLYSLQKIKGAFKPTSSWGPRDAALNAKYKEYIRTID